MNESQKAIIRGQNRQLLKCEGMLDECELAFRDVAEDESVKGKFEHFAWRAQNIARAIDALSKDLHPWLK